MQALRGTRDLLPAECRKFRHVEGIATDIAKLYGFEEIETPVLEPAAVFKRSLGETSDVVSKQMYLFKDLGGDEIVLRPEGTAGVARAFISEGLAQQLPLKLFYRGPMFRYERPQKGRYRQFYQMGVELLGVDKPQADVEVIAMGAQILKALGLQGNVKLHLNTIGDAESRAAYREKLVTYLTTRQSELSEDSKTRLTKNPLRILDSKDEGDKRVIADAPTLADSLNEVSRNFFAGVRFGLEKLDIEAVIDPLLVRGLDYYCHTVFEFTTDALGSQNAILSGGRYDNLISDLGGPKTAGVGWAAGVDRLTLMLPELANAQRPVAIIPLGEEAEAAAITLVQQLRSQRIAADLGYSGNMAKRMKRADKIGARCAVIMGSEEIAKGVYQVKWLDNGTQTAVPQADLIATLLSNDGANEGAANV